MAISLVAVGQKITASLMNLLIGQANKQGLTTIIPTAGTGATVSSTGAITFTAQSSVSFDGLTNAYDNIRLEVAFIQSASADMQMLVRTGGANVTSSNYNSERGVASGASASYIQGLAAAQWVITVASGTALTYVRGTIEVFSLPLASPTSIVVGPLAGHVGNTVMRTDIMTGSQSLSTAYSGLTIRPASGTITGTIRVYGYNNN